MINGHAVGYRGIDIVMAQVLDTGDGRLLRYVYRACKPDSLDVLDLAKRGCLFLTRPTLYGYTRNRDELLLSARRYFTAITSALLHVEAGIPFPLQDAAEEHKHLEDRSIVGSPVRIP